MFASFFYFGFGIRINNAILNWDLIRVSTTNAYHANLYYTFISSFPHYNYYLAIWILFRFKLLQRMLIIKKMDYNLTVFIFVHLFFFLNAFW